MTLNTHVQNLYKQMKRLHLFLTVLAIIIGCISVKAENWDIQTDGLALCTYNDRYHRWNKWSDWKTCNVVININTDNDKITIYSQEVQIYKIYDYVDGRYDRDGDYRVEFKFRDQDGDYGTMYMLTKRNGDKQLYIVFNNIQWVYNISNY